MTTSANPPNPPKLPKVLEETISALERKFLFTEVETNTKGTVDSSYKDRKETHMIDFSGYMERGKFARVSLTIIIADKMEKLYLGG